jgi:hypothetical protein
MEVFAYLDAGTGSLIVQSVIGAIVGIGVILKVYWGKLAGIFKKSDSSPADTAKNQKTKEVSKNTKTTK